MAVQAKIKMIPATHQNDSGFSAPAKTSATFIQGAPVKLSSGNLAAPTENSSSGASSHTDFVSKSSTANVIGLTAGKTVASSTNNVLVHKFQEGMEFIGNLVHSTASSAKVSKVGSTVYLGKDASSDTHWGWSLSAPGANSGSYIQGVITRVLDPVSTVNGRVQAQVTVGGALGAF